MTTLITKTPLQIFHELVDAEAYFNFFGIPYDIKVMQVNRLHILKKFSNLIKGIDPEQVLTENEILNQYRDALIESYQVFEESTALHQKLFKVFHDQPGNVVRLSEIGSF